MLAALLRRSGDFASCEDAVQEALRAAAAQWPNDGVPRDPRAWLIRVASRRLIDGHRSDDARRSREQRHARDPLIVVTVEAPDSSSGDRLDDTIRMLILCAHPVLSPASQVALSLRAVSGLTTAQIASAFQVPTSTMTRRIARAKASIGAEGHRLPGPTAGDLAARLDAVRHALFLTFNEGYTRSSGNRLVDVDLAVEAIRLAHQLHLHLPSDAETTGLLALMLLTHARSAGRVDAAGDLIPLAEQDRTTWDGDLVGRGLRLIEEALPVGPVGPFQIQAAIAAVHDEAAEAADTDWPQIAVLYTMLHELAPSPTVTLNRAVAIGMAQGANAGLDALAGLLADPAQQRNHRLHAAHAHLLELAGRPDAAAPAYLRAAGLTSSIPEQRYLNRRAAEAARPPV